MRRNPVLDPEWGERDPDSGIKEGGEPDLPDIGIPPDLWGHRWKFRYGPIRLSVVAGEAVYSKPRTHLPDFDDYEAYEIAMLHDDGHWPIPSDIGIHGFDGFFEGRSSPGDSVVAPYVPKEEVLRLKDALKAWQGQQGESPMAPNPIFTQSRKRVITQISRERLEQRVNVLAADPIIRNWVMNYLMDQHWETIGQSEKSLDRVIKTAIKEAMTEYAISIGTDQETSEILSVMDDMNLQGMFEAIGKQASVIVVEMAYLRHTVHELKRLGIPLIGKEWKAFATVPLHRKHDLERVGRTVASFGIRGAPITDGKHFIMVVPADRYEEARQRLGEGTFVPPVHIRYDDNPCEGV